MRQSSRLHDKATLTEHASYLKWMNKRYKLHFFGIQPLNKKEANYFLSELAVLSLNLNLSISSEAKSLNRKVKELNICSMDMSEVIPNSDSASCYSPCPVNSACEPQRNHYLSEGVATHANDRAGPSGIDERKKSNRIFSEQELESVFKKTHYPNVNSVKKLALVLGLSEAEVLVWFRHRRRQKTTLDKFGTENRQPKRQSPRTSGKVTLEEKAHYLKWMSDRYELHISGVHRLNKKEVSYFMSELVALSRSVDMGISSEAKSLSQKIGELNTPREQEVYTSMTENKQTLGCITNTYTLSTATSINFENASKVFPTSTQEAELKKHETVTRPDQLSVFSSDARPFCLDELEISTNFLNPKPPGSLPDDCGKCDESVNLQLGRQHAQSDEESEDFYGWNHTNDVGNLSEVRDEVRNSNERQNQTEIPGNSKFADQQNNAIFHRSKVNLDDTLVGDATINASQEPIFSHTEELPTYSRNVPIAPITQIEYSNFEHLDVNADIEMFKNMDMLRADSSEPWILTIDNMDVSKDIGMFDALKAGGAMKKMRLDLDTDTAPATVSNFDVELLTNQNFHTQDGNQVTVRENAKQRGQENVAQDCNETNEKLNMQSSDDSNAFCKDQIAPIENAAEISKGVLLTFPSFSLADAQLNKNLETIPQTSNDKNANFNGVTDAIEEFSEMIIEDTPRDLVLLQMGRASKIPLEIKNKRAAGAAVCLESPLDRQFSQMTIIGNDLESSDAIIRKKIIDTNVSKSVYSDSQMELEYYNNVSNDVLTKKNYSETSPHVESSRMDLESEMLGKETPMDLEPSDASMLNNVIEGTQYSEEIEKKNRRILELKYTQMIIAGNARTCTDLQHNLKSQKSHIIETPLEDDQTSVESEGTLVFVDDSSNGSLEGYKNSLVQKEKEGFAKNPTINNPEDLNSPKRNTVTDQQIWHKKTPEKVNTGINEQILTSRTATEANTSSSFDILNPVNERIPSPQRCTDTTKRNNGRFSKGKCHIYKHFKARSGKKHRLDDTEESSYVNKHFLLDISSERQHSLQNPVDDTYMKVRIEKSQPPTEEKQVVPCPMYKLTDKTVLVHPNQNEDTIGTRKLLHHPDQTKHTIVRNCDQNEDTAGTRIGGKIQYPEKCKNKRDYLKEKGNNKEEMRVLHNIGEDKSMFLNLNKERDMKGKTNPENPVNNRKDDLTNSGKDIMFPLHNSAEDMDTNAGFDEEVETNAGFNEEDVETSPAAFDEVEFCLRLKEKFNKIKEGGVIDGSFVDALKDVSELVNHAGERFINELRQIEEEKVQVRRQTRGPINPFLFNASTMESPVEEDEFKEPSDEKIEEDLRQIAYNMLQYHNQEAGEGLSNVREDVEVPDWRSLFDR